MKDFDDYATSMAECLLPDDQIAAVQVYHFICESWTLARLRRLQGHLIRIKADRAKPGTGRVPRVSEQEERAALAINGGFDTFVKIDFLISQSAKRQSDLLNQIAWYRAELAEALRKKQELEEQAANTEHTRVMNMREDWLQERVKYHEEKAKKQEHSKGGNGAEEHK
jgi:hypothetical protein